MVLDVLLDQGHAGRLHARPHRRARAHEARPRRPGAATWPRPLAALEIEHVTSTAEGTPLMRSTDVFLPRSLDLHVMRWLEDLPPVPAIERGT